MAEQRGRVVAEPSNRRVRVVFGGTVIADSVDALHVWENPWYPQFYVPRHDVIDGALEPTGTTTRSPSRGTAQHFTVRAGDKVAVDAAWSYSDSPIEVLRDHVRFEWDAMDAWFEEDQEMFVHPRNPSTRIEILPSSRHVEIEYEGLRLASSDRPVFLFESGLPRRIYLPKFDIRMDLLIESDSTSRCPYKGTASYWSLDAPGHRRVDLAWGYPVPVHESARIAGLVAFYDEIVDVTIDGERQARPKTHFV
jgi:uncharacterized protein (DUF427 family)